MHDDDIWNLDERRVRLDHSATCIHNAGRFVMSHVAPGSLLSTKRKEINPIPDLDQLIGRTEKEVAALRPGEYLEWQSLSTLFVQHFLDVERRQFSNASKFNAVLAVLPVVVVVTEKPIARTVSVQESVQQNVRPRTRSAARHRRDRFSADVAVYKRNDSTRARV